MENYSLQGKENLKILSQANNFTDWLYSEVKPFIFGNVLEIGSGKGTYSQKIINDFKGRIMLSDIDSRYAEELENKFKSYGNVDIRQLDLKDIGDLVSDYKIDTIVALNVIEHIEDDEMALRGAYKVLSPGGRLILLMPAHKLLFNVIDLAVGHYRRYNKKELSDKIGRTPFKIKKIFYFNFPAILGWLMNGHILRRSVMSGNLMKFFDKLVPIFRRVEKYLLRKKIGISLIAVLEK